ncbi:MAG TPA: Imm52 family immunity protein [Flavisolibacter sp.]|nr:Imm52 family immunity protein [Flavisolibacter sp.]
MVDSFYLGAYWTQRKEGLDIVVSKTLSFMHELVKLDEQFFNWYEQGYTKKEALSKKIIIDKEYIEKLYKKSVKKNDLGSDGFSKIGYSIDLWSGHQEEYSSSLSINCGHSSKYFSNCCVITMPSDGRQKERLLSLVKQKELFDLLIKSWNPDNIILSSNRLKNEIGTDEVGWITYYKLIRRIPKISDKIMYEKYSGGHLFYLANKNSYDYHLVKELLPLKGIIK